MIKKLGVVPNAKNPTDTYEIIISFVHGDSIDDDTVTLKDSNPENVETLYRIFTKYKTLNHHLRNYRELVKILGADTAELICETLPNDLLSQALYLVEVTSVEVRHYDSNGVESYTEVVD